MGAPFTTFAQQGASIEGDVYLLNKAGDVKKGAAGTVGLLPVGPKTDAAVMAACSVNSAKTSVAIKAIKAAGASVDAQTAALFATMNQEVEDRITQLMTAAVMRSPTGMDAHYRFPGVKPGRYIIISYMKMGKDTEPWAVPVTVASGKSLRIDLDNNNTGAIAIGCK